MKQYFIIIKYMYIKVDAKNGSKKKKKKKKKNLTLLPLFLIRYVYKLYIKYGVYGGGVNVRGMWR